MDIGVPDGKPYYIDFSDDYYYRITRAGSLYEKLAALESLTSTQARFFRVDSFADQDRYSINYYRLFKDQMLNLLSGVIRNDASTYGGYVAGAGVHAVTGGRSRHLRQGHLRHPALPAAERQAGRYARQQDHPLLRPGIGPGPARFDLGQHPRLLQLHQRHVERVQRRRHLCRGDAGGRVRGSHVPSGLPRGAGRSGTARASG